jgi:nucleoside-triphosphatase THEP1
MNILLTGAPLVGKTTLIKQLATASPGSFWVISERSLDAAGVRNGFTATTSTGLTGKFDEREETTPDTPMGNHQVDVAEVDRLFTTPLNAALDQGFEVLIVDEIGRLQRQSPGFIKTIDRLLDAQATVLATLRQGDEWTTSYTSRPDVINLTLTPANREELAGALQALLASLRMYRSLPADRQAKVLELARSYGAGDQMSSLRKLFQNTLIYLAENRYEKVSPGLYRVNGLTRSHEVFVNDGAWSCDCDLANGRGKYTGHPSECSHIQTIKIAQP